MRCRRIDRGIQTALRQQHALGVTTRCQHTTVRRQARNNAPNVVTHVHQCVPQRHDGREGHGAATATASSTLRLVSDTAEAPQRTGDRSVVDGVYRRQYTLWWARGNGGEETTQYNDTDDVQSDTEGGHVRHNAGVCSRGHGEDTPTIPHRARGRDTCYPPLSSVGFDVDMGNITAVTFTHSTRGDVSTKLIVTDILHTRASASSSPRKLPDARP